MSAVDGISYWRRDVDSPSAATASEETETTWTVRQRGSLRPNAPAQLRGADGRDTQCSVARPMGARPDAPRSPRRLQRLVRRPPLPGARSTSRRGGLARRASPPAHRPLPVHRAQVTAAASRERCRGASGRTEAPLDRHPPPLNEARPRSPNSSSAPAERVRLTRIGQTGLTSAKLHPLQPVRPDVALAETLRSAPSQHRVRPRKAQPEAGSRIARAAAKSSCHRPGTTQHGGRATSAPGAVTRLADTSAKRSDRLGRQSSACWKQFASRIVRPVVTEVVHPIGDVLRSGPVRSSRRDEHSSADARRIAQAKARRRQGDHPGR
jgi:hypothetical protein